MFGTKKNKDTKEKTKLTYIFRSKKFWTQFLWLLFMFAGCAIAIAYRSIVLFTAIIVSAFLGMNEFGRWKYKTNLVICSAITICGSVAGVFSWLETGAILIMMCIVGGFVLYYRDRVRILLPAMTEFSDVLAYCTDEAEVAWKAHSMLCRMLPGCKVFVMLSDDIGSLYLPEHGDNPRRKLNRGGGVVWKCYASSMPYRRSSIVVEHDLPLYREARSLIAAPIIAHGDAIGVIEIESRIPSFFSVEDKDRLALLAYLTGQAICAVGSKSCEDYTEVQQDD